MKKLILIALTLALLAPAIAAQEPVRYRVTLRTADPSEADTVAKQLAAEYRGRLEPFSEEGFTGFVIMMREPLARVMSADPRVARIEAVSAAAQAAPVRTVAASSRPIDVQASSGSASWSTGAYRYDGSGNIKTIGSDVYVYDALHRLTRGTAGPQREQAYSYDRFGNILTVQTDNNAFLTTMLFVDSQSNRLKSAAQDPGAAFNAYGTYDAAGRMLSVSTADFAARRKFAWDAFDMMLTSEKDLGGSSGDPERKRYLYSPSDERIAVIEDDSVEWTVRNPEGQVLRRYTSPALNATLSWKEDYIYRGRSLLAAEVARDNDGRPRRRQFHLDHLGTPRLITVDGSVELSRHTYYPFGALVTEAYIGELDQLQFTGHERDEPALDYMHARYYNGTLGRFLSVDPVLDEAANIPKPQRWNRYAYVLNNPVNAVDPDGREVVYKDQYSCDAVQAARKISPATDVTVKDFEQDKTKLLVFTTGDAPDRGPGKRLGHTRTTRPQNPADEPREFLVVLDEKDIKNAGTDRRFVVIHEVVGHVLPNSVTPMNEIAPDANVREKQSQQRTAQEIKRIPRQQRPRVPSDNEQP
jgi:RHS repeat-associated protein